MMLTGLVTCVGQRQAGKAAAVIPILVMGHILNADSLNYADDAFLW